MVKWLIAVTELVPSMFMEYLKISNLVKKGMNSGQASHYVTLSSNNLTEYATYLIVELGVLALSESVAITLEVDTSIV